MGLMKRLATTISGRANELLDRIEDPREVLDFVYEVEVDELAKVEKAVDHLAATRALLATQLAELEAAREMLGSRARGAVGEGHDDQAREALARRTLIEDGIEVLRVQADELAVEDDRFIQATTQLERQVSLVGARKEALKAAYSATGTKEDIESAIAERRSEVATVDLAVRRAEAKITELRGTSRTVAELLRLGALTVPSEPSGTIAARLRAERVSSALDDELARIKKEPIVR
jgi:phage shock protein A